VPARRCVTVVAIVALCAPMGACGKGGTRDEEAVRATLDRFVAAVAKKDYQQLCDELLDPKLLESLQARNLPCELALRTGLEDVRKPSLTVRRIRVDGTRASAVVRTTAQNQRPSEDDVQLVKRDGTWRIARLAS
jgi:hypothetical protein